MNICDKNSTQILVSSALLELNIHLKKTISPCPHSTHSLSDFKVILYKMVYIVLIYSCFSLKMENRCCITFIECVKIYNFFLLQDISTLIKKKKNIGKSFALGLLD